MSFILNQEMLFKDGERDSLPACPDYAARMLGVELKNIDSEGVAYLNQHWLRLVHTFQLLPILTDSNASLVVEVGASSIYVDKLRACFPKANFKFGGKPFLRYDDDDFFDVDLEKDQLPFDDGSVDVMIALEVVEHFFNDPMAFFAEVSRVLKPGGQLVMTTPNIASLRSLRSLLLHYPPYYYVKYAPGKPVWATHRREFTIRDMAEFARAGGFASEIRTFDAYVNADKQSNLVEAFEQIGFSLLDRGDTIFSVFTKESNTVVDRYPDWFYC